MCDNSKYSNDEEYSKIRVQYMVESSGLFSFKVFYHGDLIYIYDTNKEYTDKILEKTNSLSVNDKQIYFQELISNANKFIDYLESHDKYQYDEFKSNIILLKENVFPRIAMILNDDFFGSREYTTYKDTIKHEEKSINFETVDNIVKNYEHTLAILFEDGFIDRIVNSDGQNEYQLSVPLTKVMSYLVELKELRRISIPDDDKSREGFIKRYIKDKTGKIIEGNIRTLRHNRKTSTKLHKNCLFSLKFICFC